MQDVICSVQEKGVVSLGFIGDAARGKTIRAHVHEAVELFRQYGWPPEIKSKLWA